MWDVRNQDNNCEFPDFEYRRTDYKNLSAQFCLVTKNSSRIIVVVQKTAFYQKEKAVRALQVREETRDWRAAFS